MGLGIDRTQALDRHVRVDLRGRQVRVSEEILNGLEVRTAVQEVRGEGVAQRVRRRLAQEPGAEGMALDDAPERARRQASAAEVQEDRVRGLRRRV